MPETRVQRVRPSVSSPEILAYNIPPDDWIHVPTQTDRFDRYSIPEGTWVENGMVFTRNSPHSIGVWTDPDYRFAPRRFTDPGQISLEYNVSSGGIVRCGGRYIGVYTPDPGTIHPDPGGVSSWNAVMGDPPPRRPSQCILEKKDYVIIRDAINKLLDVLKERPHPHLESFTAEVTALKRKFYRHFGTAIVNK